MDTREFLSEMFDAAVAAARPSVCVPKFLPPAPKGRTVVIGAGKAAAAMARAAEENWPGPLSGAVATRYGHAVACDRIEVLEAAHPVPDPNSEQAARRMLGLVHGLGPDDLVLCLMSGGASALMSLPAPGLTHAGKQDMNAALLRCGANISEMNCVRKHLSAVKGGRLAAAAAPARVVTLMISDVPGDDPAVIGSGPTVGDGSTLADARAVLQKYGIAVPAALNMAANETPKPDDPVFRNTEWHLIATPQQSLEAAAAVVRDAGIAPVILGDAIEGEARDVAKVFAGIARQVKRYGQPAAAPAVLLSGGETTVTVRGSGKGGRNAEFLLALAVALDGADGVSAMAGDTDGIDGSEDNAGAFLLPDSLSRAAGKEMDAKAYLANNDGYGFFAALDDLVITGPTLTNVNDFRAILISA